MSLKDIETIASSQFHMLNPNVKDALHRPSFVAGFVSAISCGRESLRDHAVGACAWQRYPDIKPPKGGRYYVAQIGKDGKPYLTTRKWLARSKMWHSEGDGNTVYAWIPHECPPF